MSARATGALRPGRRLRIAVVTETYPPEVNGVAATIAVMVRGLLARGHRIEVIRPRQRSDRGHAATPSCDLMLVRGLPIPGYETLRFGMPSTRRLIDRWRSVRPDVVQVVTEGLRRARRGEKVVLVPGNHDEALREYSDTFFGGIHVVERHSHVAADGRRYLLIHGDEFDQVTRYHRWVAKLGDAAYEALVRANASLSSVRRTLRIPGYWSLAGYAKHKVKSAIDFVFDFEDSVVRYAKSQGFDGVICGHVHCAAHKSIDGIVYINCGDWVDSCTGIVERLDGRMQVIRWSEVEAGREVILLDQRRVRRAASSGKAG